VKRIIGHTVGRSMPVEDFEHFRRAVSYRLELENGAGDEGGVRGLPKIWVPMGDTLLKFEGWEISKFLLQYIYKVSIHVLFSIKCHGWGGKERISRRQWLSVQEVEAILSLELVSIFSHKYRCRCYCHTCAAIFQPLKIAGHLKIKDFYT
jgi:hypothetical protein